MLGTNVLFQGGYFGGIRSHLGGLTQRVKSWYWGRPLVSANKYWKLFFLNFWVLWFLLTIENCHWRYLNCRYFWEFLFGLTSFRCFILLWIFIFFLNSNEMVFDFFLNNYCNHFWNMNNWVVNCNGYVRWE